MGTEGRNLAATEEAGREEAAVDLYWLPLGAGGHFVRFNGRIYEALAARMQRRPVCDLYHSALQVELAGERFVIEQTPVPRLSGEDHGAVAGGAVGARWASRFRIFRYEIRVWRGGHIPDVAEAVDSPRRLTNDAHQARRVLEVVRQVPTPVWGRDELHTGEGWNSNAVIAWVSRAAGSTLGRFDRRRVVECLVGKPASSSQVGSERVPNVWGGANRPLTPAGNGAAGAR